MKKESQQIIPVNLAPSVRQCLWALEAYLWQGQRAIKVDSQANIRLQLAAPLRTVFEQDEGLSDGLAHNVVEVQVQGVLEEIWQEKTRYCIVVQGEVLVYPNSGSVYTYRCVIRILVPEHIGELELGDRKIR